MGIGTDIGGSIVSANLCDGVNILPDAGNRLESSGCALRPLRNESICG